MANTLFGMMNSSTTGLMTSQAAINVTGNNIANVNTTGYTRQRVTVGNARPIYMNGMGYLGTGVQIKDIQRIRDQHLDVQLRNETSTLKEFEAKEEIMNELETIFNEPSETGLNKMMTEMWNAWEELSKNADNSTMQTLVKENSKAVADQLNHFTTLLNKTIEGIEARQDSQTEMVANIITQINDVNKLLVNAYKTDPTKSPNELLDQRDALTQQLSEYMPIEVTIKDNHTIEVKTSVNGQDTDVLALDKQGLDQRDALTQQLSEYMPIEVTIKDNHTIEVKTSVNGQDTDVLALDKQGIKDMIPNLKTGALKGFEDCKTYVNDYQKQLDQYTVALTDAINDIHQNHGGKPIFTLDKNNPAGTVTLNPNLDDIVAGTTGAGDGSVALEILKLRDETVTIGGVTTKFDQYYKDLIGDVGVKSQHAQSMVKGQQTLISYLEERQESVSGVSIDEEVVNLVQFQKAYDANARVISTITEMLDTIINRLGV